MKSASIAAAMLLAAGTCAAMNVADVPVKCTSPDGKVSYQRGSCPPGTKIEVVRGDTPVGKPDDTWQFERSVDPMTNAARCTATSPKFDIPAKRNYVQAQIVVVYLNSSRPFVAVANRSTGSVFHHDIRGTGLKIGQAVMTPFGSRPSQTVLALPQGSETTTIDSMLDSTTARARVRLWPWDETYDSLEISLSGFKQAHTLAKQCSNSL